MEAVSPLLILLLFSLTIEAQAITKCESLFSEVAGLPAIHEFDLTEAGDFFVNPPADAGPSVHISEAFGDNDQNMLFLAKREQGEYWRSWFGHSILTPQGDLRTVLALFGPELAGQLGFAFIDSEKILAPHPSTFALRFEKLGIQSVIRFKAVSGEEKVTDFHFLNDWVQDSLIPLAIPASEMTGGLPKDHLYLHDMSFHSSSFITPDEYLVHNKLQTRAFLEFYNFLKDQYVQRSELRFARNKGLENKLLKVMAESFDIANGSLGSSMAMDTKVEEPWNKRPSQSEYGFLLNHLTNYGMSPNERLKSTWVEVLRASLTIDKNEKDILISLLDEYLSVQEGEWGDSVMDDGLSRAEMRKVFIWRLWERLGEIKSQFNITEGTS